MQKISLAAFFGVLLLSSLALAAPEQNVNTVSSFFSAVSAFLTGIFNYPPATQTFTTTTTGLSISASTTLQNAGAAPNQICGNGIKEGSEECDDGNKISGDGCSANCTLEAKKGAPLTTTTTSGSATTATTGQQINAPTPENINSVAPPNQVCGNGQKESLEECDDGNRVSGDGCSANCTFETTTTLQGVPLVTTTSAPKLSLIQRVASSGFGQSIINFFSKLFPAGPLPDLVVRDVKVSGDNLEVTVENIGSASATFSSDIIEIGAWKPAKNVMCKASGNNCIDNPQYINKLCSRSGGRCTTRISQTGYGQCACVWRQGANDLKATSPITLNAGKSTVVTIQNIAASDDDTEFSVEIKSAGKFRESSDANNKLTKNLAAK